MPFSRNVSYSLLLAIFSSLAVQDLFGQAPKPEPDVLIFMNGEKLIGEFERSTGDSLTFKSEMAGEVKVDWSKIKELRTSKPFAVIRKNVKVQKNVNAQQVPQGSLTATAQQIEIHTAEHPPEAVPVGEAAYVVDKATFEKVLLHHPGILQAWQGAVTGGVSLVEATQNSQTFTGGIALVRAVPTVEWLDPRNRTIVDFSASSGKLTQPNTPTVKTSIYHADAEYDKYFTSRVFGFAQLAYDHNFSQGLDLQQNYGGGLGWTALKSSNQTLDLKASANYLHQQFQISQNNQSLIGSTFGERYSRTLHKSILFTEQLSFIPAWNNTAAFSALGSAGLTMPVYKRLSLALSAIDTFLNDPPPGFKKNSFQLTTGLSYTLP